MTKGIRKLLSFCSQKNRATYDNDERTRHVDIEDTKPSNGNKVSSEDNGHTELEMDYEKNKVSRTATGDSQNFFSCKETMEEFDEDTKEGLRTLRSSLHFDDKMLEGYKMSLLLPVIMEQQDMLDGLEYAPAKVLDPHRPSDVTLDHPETLLLHDNHDDHSNKKHPSFRFRGSVAIKGALEQPAIKMNIPGYPGELSSQELQSCLDLRKYLLKESNKIQKEIALSLFGIETDEYALCRQLRSRKFVVADVLEHLEEGVEIWKEGKAANFYPNAQEALGADPSIVISQFPYMYSGYAKNGCPVLYFKGGKTDMNGLECVMNVANMEKYAWHMLMYKFKDVVRQSMKKNGVIRTEQILIIDLNGLSSKSIADICGVVKMITKVGTCFPEMMNRTIIVNAPTFFSFAWKMVKTFLDARTQSKISLFSNHIKGMEKMNELIDDDQLLSDYGGSASSFDEVMQSLSNEDDTNDGCKRQIVEIISKSRKSVDIKLDVGEKCELTVYTRSTSGAIFTIQREDNALVSTSDVKNPTPSSKDDKDPKPYNVVISRVLEGRNTYNIKAKSLTSNALDNFLVVGKVRHISKE